MDFTEYHLFSTDCVWGLQSERAERTGKKFQPSKKEGEIL